MAPDELQPLVEALRRAAKCDLGTWDRDFVEDMRRRLDKWGLITAISPRQWLQIERIKEQYL